MRTLTLTRDTMSGGTTTGTLSEDGVEICQTLELEYWDNANNVSCIPIGVYICKLISSPHFGLTYEVTGVEGRSHILFHSGNTEKDTHGCILVGTCRVHPNGELVLTKSHIAHEELMWRLHGADEFSLVIIEEHPINE